MNEEVGRVTPGAGAWRLRGTVASLAIVLAGVVFVFQDTVPGRVRAAAGVVCFTLIVIACSSDIRAIRWRTVGWGLGLQLTLAVAILRFEVGGVRPGYEFFSGLAAVVTQFLEFTNVGSEFVFGVLANQEEMGRLFPNGTGAGFCRAADHHLRLVGVHRAVSLGCAAAGSHPHGSADDAADADERSGDPFSCGQRVHGPDRSADHRQTVYPRDDPVGATDADDRWLGHHRGERAGRVHQFGGRPCGHPHDERDGGSVRSLSVQDLDARDREARDVQHCKGSRGTRAREHY